MSRVGCRFLFSFLLSSRAIEAFNCLVLLRLALNPIHLHSIVFVRALPSLMRCLL